MLTVIPIVADVLGTVVKGKEKKTGGIVNQRKNRDCVKINEDTQTCCHSAPSERLPANAGVEKLARCIIIIILMSRCQHGFPLTLSRHPSSIVHRSN